VIDPRAIIDPSARIDDGVEIGPWTHIGPDVEIGPDSRIACHVVVMVPARIGRRCRLAPFVVGPTGSVAAAIPPA
jgi:UDP-N-acetylglucosamine acyltransferase